jgi:heptosyltransferase-2
VTGKTIIYLPNWLGDVVMATPFLHSLRQSLEGEFWGVGKSTAMHLYNGLNLFNRFIPVDDKSLVGFLDVVNDVRSVGFERGILLPHSFRSALLFFLGSVESRIGYARNMRGLLLTGRVEEATDRPEPTVEHYLRILDVLGAERHIESPLLAVTEDEEHRFDEHFMDVGGEYVAFIIGASYGPSKCWPDRYFSELADMITDNFPLRVYVLPGKGEEKIADNVCRAVKNSERVEVKHMDVRDLKVCLSRASLVVSNDTGPRHISVALSVPTIVLLGPMDERYTSYSNNCTYVLKNNVSCRPCNKKRCDRDHECMRGITPADVLRTVEEVLGESISRAN